MMSRIYKGWLALSVALPIAWLSLDSEGAAERRSYVAGNFGLELDGGFVGFVKSMGGGAAVAEVVEEASGAGSFPKKHVGRITYEDIEVDVGVSMGAPLLDWIAASWQARAPRKNGAIIAYDHKLDAVQSTEFTGALLTETTIPACDAASKEAAFITLRISPERTQTGKAAGKASSVGKAEKAWLASNFRLDLDGMDTSRVMRVEGFTVKTKTAASRAGSDRAANKEPGQLAIPNLKVTFAAVSAESWSKWHADMVNGAGGDKLERNGRLVFLGPDRKQELLEIKLSGVGMIALRSPKPSTLADSVAKLEAELYAERMEFVHKAGQ